MCGCERKSHCGCDKHHHYSPQPINPCKNCNTEWSGYYTASGYTYLLNEDGTGTTTPATRTYLITKVDDYMYKVVMNSLTPDQFTLESLFFKKGSKLYSSSNIGLDIISCEGNQLVADFSTNNPDKLNGRFILTPALLA